MKTIITIIILAIVGVCVFSACTVLPALAAVVDPSTPPQNWSHIAHLEELMKTLN